MQGSNTSGRYPFPTAHQPGSARLTKLSRLRLSVGSTKGTVGGGVGRTSLGLLMLACVGFWAGGRHRSHHESALINLAKVHTRIDKAVLSKEAAAMALEAARETVLGSQAELLKVHGQHLTMPTYPSSDLGVIATPSTEPTLDVSRLCAPPTGKAKDAATRGLPILVFICGVEGAGHHAMEAVLDDLGAKADLVYTGYNPGLHSFAKHTNVSRAYQFPNISLANYEATFSRHLAGKKLHGKPLIIDSRNSYPEGFGCGTLAHPDLVFLAHLDGVLFDLRVLVVVRDPVAAVMSSVRRFNVKEFTYKNYQFQARAVQEGLTMINNGLAAVPCGKAYVLPYDDMLRAPAACAPQLAELFGVDSADLAASMTLKLKHPSPKTMVGDVEVMRQHLEDFFEEQKSLWPILSGERKLPAINVAPTKVGPPQMLAEVSAALSVPTTVGRPEGDEAAVVRRQNKYLAVTWYTNLGFNNMRFILETALYLARLLDRQLILPPRLRMRTCLDEAVCLQSKCIKQDGHFWCPTTSFLSWSELNRAGAVNPKVTAEFLKGKTRRAVDGAFSEMFSKSTLFLDSLASLPPTVRTGLNSTGHYSPPSTSKAVEFDFYKFHLGCELTYSKVDTATWSSTRDRDTAMGIRGLVDEYGDMSEEVLHLKGTPHNIGLTPTFWATRQSLDASREVWESAVRYHPAADKIAELIADRLVPPSIGAAKPSSFMCVHFRRGDFVTAGWLGKAKDLDLVASNIARHRRGSTEPVYMATDERNATVLAHFRSLGILTYGDFRAHAESEAAARWRPMLAFEDYVGIVEQLVCSRARLFIGSKCSSYSGGIWNLRRRLLNDTSMLFTADIPKTPKQTHDPKPAGMAKPKAQTQAQTTKKKKGTKRATSKAKKAPVKPRR